MFAPRRSALSSRLLIASLVFVVASGVLPWLPAEAVGGEHQWLDQFGLSADSSTYGVAVALDSQGNVFAAGGGGYNAGGFLVKYTADGQKAWTRTIAADYNAELATDPAGNVVVWYSAYDASFGRAAVLAKYDTNGNLLWSSPLSAYSDSGGVAVDGLGAVYVSGYESYFGYFLRRYNTAGNVIWTKWLSDGYGPVAVDGSGFVYVKNWYSMYKVDSSGSDVWAPPRPLPVDGTASGGFAVDASGDVYVVGWIPDLPPPGQVESGRTDIILRKYDDDFIQAWARQFGTPADDYPGDVAVGGGGVFVTGQTNGVFPGQAYAGGTSDGFVRLYRPDGQDAWTFEFGTSGEESLPAAAAGASDRAFVAGTTDGSFPGRTRASQRDAFVSRIEPLGPTASGVVLTPDPVGTGDPVHLTATIDDSASGNSAVASASYTVDGGTPVGLLADGGAFGTPVVSVEATIPAFAEPGQHTICVSGTDAATNQGPEECANLMVNLTEPPPEPDVVGPTTSGVVVTPNPSVAGQAVVLQAIVNDQVTGDSPVVSARYSIDSGPPVAMAATDGAFGEPLEAVTANIVLPDPGVYSLCVSGLDAAGNLGTAQCVSLTVNQPPPPPPPPDDTTGPVTTELVAAPSPVVAGAAVVLNAIVDDRATGGSGIAAASYRIDGGNLSPLAASDGAFGQPAEAVRTTVVFAAAGVYSLCVAATDSEENTGVAACTLVTVTAPPPPPPPPPPPTEVLGETLRQPGYWLVGADGRVFPFGIAVHLGEPAGSLGTAQAVDIESTPSGNGYWVLDDAGRVYSYGDAQHYGGVQQLPAGERATSLSGVPNGRGYWIFTTAGRVITFGDAGFFGDMSSVRLNGGVLDSVATPSGLGYYMVASDGGVFTFGDARFAGSMGDTKLNAPVQSLVADSDGSGYWLVAGDGGIFAFDAPFKGSLGSIRLNKPVAGMVRFGDGYLMVAEDGGIFNFSSLPFSGSLGANPPAQPIVAVAPVGG